MMELGEISTDFDGAYYEEDRDYKSLSGQMQAIFQVLSESGWLTVRQITTRVESLLQKPCAETSISANVRNLRKKKFGGYNVKIRRLDSGLWEYKLVKTTEPMV